MTVPGGLLRKLPAYPGEAAQVMQDAALVDGAALHALLLETVLFQYPGRAQVEVDDRGLQPEQAKLIHHPGCEQADYSGHQALPPMSLAEPVAQFRGMPALGHALLGANAATGLALYLDGQVQRAWGQYAPAQEGFAILAGVGIREAVTQPTRDVRVVGVMQQRLQVITAPGAQQEACAVQAPVYGSPWT